MPSIISENQANYLESKKKKLKQQNKKNSNMKKFKITGNMSKRCIGQHLILKNKAR